MNGYEIIVLDEPNRDYLVVEIIKENVFFADINQENGYLELTIYTQSQGKMYISNLKEFCEVLNEAKLYLRATNLNSDVIVKDTCTCEEKNGVIYIKYHERQIAIVRVFSDKVELEFTQQFENIILPFDSLYKTLLKILHTT